MLGCSNAKIEHICYQKIKKELVWTYEQITKQINKEKNSTSNFSGCCLATVIMLKQHPKLSGAVFNSK